MKQKKFKTYRFKTKDGTFIYVGFTGKEIHERVEEHIKDKYWMDEVSEVEYCYVESEAQARLNEMYFINTIKPIFNTKDKFPGAINMSLKKEYKSFSHAFYMFKRQITTCIPHLKDFSLVDINKKFNTDLGLYYDGFLRLAFSSKDLCEILDISDFAFRKIVGDNNTNFREVNYKVTINGKDYNRKMFMCDCAAIKLLNDKLNTPISNYLYRTVAVIRNRCNIRVVYGDKFKTIMQTYLHQLKELNQNRWQDNDIKRALVLECLKNNRKMDEVVSEYNLSRSVYDFKYPLEIKAQEIFSMIEDISIEYDVAYKEIFDTFNKYLKENHNLNLWKYVSDARSKDEYKQMQIHYIVAMYQDLATLFNKFYDDYI